MRGSLRSVLVASSTVLALCGCRSAREEPPDQDPGAVVVDFYHDGRPSAACSGTLVSPLVVLTAAHCADESDGARVTVAGMAGRTTEVARVLPFDWSDDVAHHAEEHDLALLVLREPLTGSAYAPLSTDNPLGQEVSLHGRAAEKGAYGRDPSRVDGLRLSTELPAGRPFAALAEGVGSGGIADAGGAVRRADGVLIGVLMGKGRDTGASYVARVDDALIAIWVEGVTSGVAADRRVVPSGGVSHPASLTGASAELVDPGAAGDSSSASEPASGGDAEPPVSTAEPLVSSSEPLLTGEQPTLLGYDRATGIQLGDPNEYSVGRGSNWWAADANDNALIQAPAFAQAHPEASFIMGHGNPGWMAGVPSTSEIVDLYNRSLSNRGRAAIVLISCYGGSASRGSSNAARIADSAGIPRATVYGCTGTMLAYSEQLYCNGRWVDGNGRAINRLPGSPLLNCVFRREGDGTVTPGSCN